MLEVILTVLKMSFMVLGILCFLMMAIAGFVKIPNPKVCENCGKDLTEDEIYWYDDFCQKCYLESWNEVDDVYPSRPKE